MNELTQEELQEIERRSIKYKEGLIRTLSKYSPEVRRKFFIPTKSPEERAIRKMVKNGRP